jgi:hypothetical protein
MKASRVILILAAGAIVIAAMLVPALRPAKIHSGPTCSTNLRLIQLAKEMYAKDFDLTNDVSPTKEQLLLPAYGLGNGWPRCPEDGEYSIGTLHQSPRCSYPNHAQLSVPTK